MSFNCHPLDLCSNAECRLRLNHSRCVLVWTCSLMQTQPWRGSKMSSTFRLCQANDDDLPAGTGSLQLAGAWPRKGFASEKIVIFVAR